MFDHYRIQSGPTHVGVDVEVHEHRAPTDRSVALLSEMEKAAQGKLISVNRLINNTLEATWYVFDNPVAFDLQGVLRFKLNGREFKIDVELDRKQTRLEHARKMALNLVEVISQHLVRELFDMPQVQQIFLR